MNFATLHSAMGSSEEAKAILAPAIGQFYELAAAKEYEKLADFYDPDAVLVHAGKDAIYGREALLKDFQDFLTRAGKLTPKSSDSHYRMCDDFIIMTADYETESEKMGLLKGKITQIWRVKLEKWSLGAHLWYGNERNYTRPVFGGLRNATDIKQLKKHHLQCVASVHLAAHHPALEPLKASCHSPLTELCELAVFLSGPQNTDIRLLNSQYFISLRCYKPEASRIFDDTMRYVIFQRYKLHITKMAVFDPNFGFRMQLCNFADRARSFDAGHLSIRLVVPAVRLFDIHGRPRNVFPIIGCHDLRDLGLGDANEKK
ncbi:unnamed protein product [Cylicocyclus nassatus]|uniref:DUF4440 domain-containing protein n=1 Tax=Cylicocyclus nassatus TaxID=53992 RepID=A0AA36DPP8_CYLNA|nr:unnamed protein product [Cylicocyclus nassatus]